MCCPTSRDTLQAHSLPRVPGCLFHTFSLLNSKAFSPASLSAPILILILQRKRERPEDSIHMFPPRVCRPLPSPSPRSAFSFLTAFPAQQMTPPPLRSLCAPSRSRGAIPGPLALTVHLCPATPRQVLRIASSDYIHGLCTACHLH